WWRQFNLPLRQVIGKDGHLLPITFGEPGWESLAPDTANANYARIAGMYTKRAQKVLMDLAEEMGGVVDRPRQEITHPVRFFEKGDRPLELIPTRQWYTRILDKKDALIEQGRKIHWHPSFMGKRYESWVEGLNQDWCMSRQRYFGVPIPLWYPIDANGIVQYGNPIVPSPDQLPVDPLDQVPQGYTEDQRNVPGGFTGDPDVFDTWATSSLTPQIASKWATAPERHKKLFPMDIRPQSHEIIRTWAFYTIVKAYLHEQEVPWRNVVISGWILDPDRKKMSKSQGNVVTPEPLLDEFGADSVRYWAARARLGVDTAYDEQVFKVGKRLCTKLFNASKFAVGRFESIDPARLGPAQVVMETDRAVVARLRDTVARATQALVEFDYAQALMLIEDFFWKTFCDNYLELAKPRTYDEDLTEARLSAAATLRLLHRAIVRMFAPYLPFLCEDVWHWCYSNDPGMHASVHRSPWPGDEELDAIAPPADARTFDVAVAVIDAVRKAKADANLSMKAPVDKVVVTATPELLALVRMAQDDIVRMLSIVTFEAGEGKPETGDVDVRVTLTPNAG
ncbi:MAG TPA: class I tRNA ligase family protein, partial [Candidatus Hydrogenedentes bacterium]|nr:class I tRNA ligase family protein [Candidatus Hydrogenedentota bacterium]